MRALWCVSIVMSGSLVAAADPDDWDGLVKEYLKVYESVKEPQPTAYLWVAKRLKTLFGVRGVVHIQFFAEKDGKMPRAMHFRIGKVRDLGCEFGFLHHSQIAQPPQSQRCPEPCTFVIGKVLDLGCEFGFPHHPQIAQFPQSQARGSRDRVSFRCRRIPRNR